VFAWIVKPELVPGSEGVCLNRFGVLRSESRVICRPFDPGSREPTTDCTERTAPGIPCGVIDDVVMAIAVVSDGASCGDFFAKDGQDGAGNRDFMPPVAVRAGDGQAVISLKPSLHCEAPGERSSRRTRKQSTVTRGPPPALAPRRGLLPAYEFVVTELELQAKVIVATRC
jgi:hypothetical protein